MPAPAPAPTLDRMGERPHFPGRSWRLSEPWRAADPFIFAASRNVARLGVSSDLLLLCRAALPDRKDSGGDLLVVVPLLEFCGLALDLDGSSTEGVFERVIVVVGPGHGLLWPCIMTILNFLRLGFCRLLRSSWRACSFALSNEPCIL